RFSRDWSSDVCSSDLSLLVLLSIMFIERHNRGNSFNIVFHTIALIRRVDGILIKTKTHQYSIDFQFVIKQSHNWDTAPIPCRNKIGRASCREREKDSV